MPIPVTKYTRNRMREYYLLGGVVIPIWDLINNCLKLGDTLVGGGARG